MYFQFAQLPPPKYSSEEGKMIESTALYQKASCSMHFNPSGKSIGLSFTSPPKASSSITITLLGIFTVSNKGHQDAKQKWDCINTFGNPYFLQCRTHGKNTLFQFLDCIWKNCFDNVTPCKSCNFNALQTLWEVYLCHSCIVESTSFNYFKRRGQDQFLKALTINETLDRNCRNSLRYNERICI